jgi:hypothetical protein
LRSAPGHEASAQFFGSLPTPVDALRSPANAGTPASLNQIVSRSTRWRWDSAAALALDALDVLYVYDPLRTSEQLVERDNLGVGDASAEQLERPNLLLVGAAVCTEELVELPYD